MTRKIGLLVMAFGTPAQPQEIEAYYTRIRGGKAPSEAQLAELEGRFEQIGGTSPLTRNTEIQAAELLKQLNSLSPEVEFTLSIGYQYVAPFIGDVVRQMYADGVREVVAVALAPHYSRYSVQGYHDLTHKAAEAFSDMKFTDVMEWWKEAGFTDFWTGAIQAELDQLPEASRAQTVVILSAHSLPEKTQKGGDVYAEQVYSSADRIAQSAGLEHYRKAWQSAGRTADTWLGPDVLDLTRELQATEGYTHFIYCPFGFVTEHLEVLFDNDIECKQLCEELGVGYHRPKMPTADPVYVGSIRSAVAKKLGL